MASNRSFKDLQWLTEAIKSETVNLQNISFHLSQPTSKCFQETENSITVSLSRDDHFHFPNLLTVLRSAKLLQNLEFHQIEWEPKQLKDLQILLDGHSNIKQLVFGRNSFGKECLLEFSDVLKNNRVVKEIMFCESGIGSFGAVLLAHALKTNDTLEELQIWDDSIGSKGAEDFSKMIDVNTTLKQLTVFDSNWGVATAIISAVLARNRVIEVHIWSKENGEKTSKVVEFVPENGILRIYKLDFSGSCTVACALGLNTTVKSLDLSGVRLKSRWAKEFRWVLEQNQSLKEVNLSNTRLKDKGVVYVSAGLFKNRTLEHLTVAGNWFGGIGVEHLLTPLSRFSSLQNQANITLKSITFGGGRTKIGRDGLVAILQMLTTNQSLTRLGICDDVSLKPDDFIKIFKSMEKHVSLRYLSLQGCKGVAGELLLHTIMETLQVNPWIEEIDLSKTPLQNLGMAESIYKKLGQNGSAEPEIDLLKDTSMTMPKSCRVFLCGQEYAGKTSLCNSIAKNFSSSKLPYMDQVRNLVQPVEEAVKPVGMKIKTFKDEDNKISIWNLASQYVFYPLHDLMFPGHGSASCFFIISSLFKKPANQEPKNATEIEEDLQYWLRFVVSNSSRAAQQCMLPNVTLVLTHFDKINQQSNNMQVIAHAIQRLKNKFQGFIEFYPTVFTVDARSSVSVAKLTHHVKKTSNAILQRVPRVYELCNDLIKIISDWRSENYNKPAMKWKEFNELCQVKVPSLRVRSRRDSKEKVEMRRRAFAKSLHHIGEVIYFEELGFLILDCEWFCGEVLGQLINLDVKKQTAPEKNGFISTKELEKILQKSLQSPIPGLSSKIFENLEASDLVQMMLKLELCYKQNPSDPNSELLIPSMLEEGRGRTQKWQVTAPDCIYAGRHLECDDSSHMFLTPGFFPRLQVHLHNKTIGANNQHGATYSLEKYLISININGIYIRVELGGHLGHYIDVLACSAKSLTETLRCLHQLIIPAIHSLCTGFSLTEYIIRRECVQNLTPPRYRRTQFLSLQNLKYTLQSVPAESMYDYQHTWSSVSDSGRQVLRSGFDYARELLSDDDFREVLHRRYHDLYSLAQELQVPSENNQVNALSTGEEQEQNGKIEPTFGGIAKGLEQVLERLRIIEQEIRDVKQEIQGLRYYEHRLLIELRQKINFLVTYNIQIEERKIPNMFYFVQTENYSRKLITNMVPGMTALKLHMLCEFRFEMHVVEDQLGCETMQIDNVAIKSLAPHMKKFMTLLTFALKIGAQLAAGMGEMIPDLSRAISHLSASSSTVHGATGAAAAGALGLGAMAIASSRTRANSRDVSQHDQREAQQWVIDFLRDQNCSTGKDIAEKFGLWRVRYSDTGQIAWICKRHIHQRAHDIVEVPI